MKQEMKYMLTIGIFMLAAIVVYSQFAPQPIQPAIQYIENGGVPVPGCLSTTTPQFTINAYDGANPGTAITGEVTLWRVEGTKTWTAGATGTAVTAGFKVGDTIEYISGITTANAEQYDNAYGPTGSILITCDEDIVEEIEMRNDEVEASITASFFNSDHTASTAQTIGAGATKPIYAKFEAGAEEDFGNRFVYQKDGKYSNLLAIKVNSSDTSDVTKLIVTQVDPEMGKVGETIYKTGCPGIVTATTSFTNYCFKVPAASDYGTEFKVYISADASVAVGVDGTASYYAGGWYVNADTGELEFGIQDEKTNAVGASDPDTLTLDFT